MRGVFYWPHYIGLVRLTGPAFELQLVRRGIPPEVLKRGVWRDDLIKERASNQAGEFSVVGYSFFIIRDREYQPCCSLVCSAPYSISDAGHRTPV